MPVFTVQDAEQIAPIFRGKGGHLLYSLCERIAGIDEVNALYDRVASLYEDVPDFAAGLLQDKEVAIDYLIGNADRLDFLPEGPFITISNHVYGHIDGIMLVDMIGHKRPDMKVMVNKILMYIERMRPSFIAVNPTGDERKAPTAESINGIKQALLQIREGGPLCLFPAGAISNLKYKGGRHLEDREWQEPLIKLIAKLHVPIIPIRFLDRNTAFFYHLGLLSSGVRLTRLCHEVFNKKHKRVRLVIGETITPEEQDPFRGDLDAFKAFLRASVYDMPVPEQFTPRSALSL